MTQIRAIGRHEEWERLINDYEMPAEMLRMTQKGTRVKILDKIIISAAVILIVTGCVIAYQVNAGYEKGQEEYEQLRNAYTNATYSKDRQVGSSTLKAQIQTEDEYGRAEEQAEINTMPEDAPVPVSVDWEGLQALNRDVVAWLQIPALELSYPVMQGEDNEYYLHHSLQKEYLYAGSIFLDCENSRNFDQYNTILYGHNMRDGSMFASLKKLADQSVYDSCPYFWIQTPQKRLLYRIFAVRQAEVNSSIYTIRFADQLSYKEWLQQMQVNNGLEQQNELQEKDKIVTLSTCTGSSTVRQVVQGVMVWQGE